jgi:hypothetical protein
MYARMVKGQFKPDKFDFVTRTLEKDVIPLLKQQKGFRDELSFFAKDMKEGYAISFWDDKKDLEKYVRDVYPKVHEKMAEAFEIQPTAHDFEVANSTWYKIHAA